MILFIMPWMELNHRPAHPSGMLYLAELHDLCSVRRDFNPHTFRHLVFIEACFATRLRRSTPFTTHLLQSQLQGLMGCLSLVHSDPDIFTVRFRPYRDWVGWLPPVSSTNVSNFLGYFDIPERNILNTWAGFSPEHRCYSRANHGGDSYGTRTRVPSVTG